MNTEAYVKGMRYEIFIRRAYGYFQRDMKNGADESYMKNLLYAEDGDSAVSHLPKAEKQLVKVREYIIKAIDKFLKKKLTTDERDRLTLLRQQAERAQSGNSLMRVVEQGLDITQRFVEQ